jgi:hypothetical protein
MSYSLTIFKHLGDISTDKRMNFDSIESFVGFFEKLSQLKYKSKKSAPLISPAVYKEGSTRSNDATLGWGNWAALDVDSHDMTSDTFKEALIEKFGKFFFICYNTASSRKEHPKFRLIFPLTIFLESSNIRKFWFALNTEMGSLGDKQTKDYSRMFFVPGDYPDAFSFFFVNEGEYIDPLLMMKKHPYVEKEGKGLFANLPPNIRKAMIQKRRDSLTKHYTWRNYRDCPFVNDKMVLDYKLIVDDGWYTALYSLMVSIAKIATLKGYPITPQEIERLVREIDSDTGSWYTKRPIIKEAVGAIEYVYSQGGF